MVPGLGHYTVPGGVYFFTVKNTKFHIFREWGAFHCSGRISPPPPGHPLISTLYKYSSAAMNIFLDWSIEESISESTCSIIQNQDYNTFIALHARKVNKNLWRAVRVGRKSETNKKLNDAWQLIFGSTKVEKAVYIQNLCASKVKKLKSRTNLNGMLIWKHAVIYQKIIDERDEKCAANIRYVMKAFLYY